MANMSYCRFQNTLRDLEDCYEHLNDDVSKDEERARKRLVQLCRDVETEFNGEEPDDE